MILRQPIPSYLTLNAIAAVFGWAYATTFATIAQRWVETPEYSHGWLIPLFPLWWIGTSGGTRTAQWFTASSIAGLLLFAIGAYLSSLGGDPGLITTAASVLACCGVATCLAGWGLPPTPCVSLWAGFTLLAFGVGVRVAAAQYYIDWLDGVSVIPVLGGLACFLYDIAAVRRLLPAIGFLVFMVPLPFSVETMLRDPLRSVATKISTYTLQAVGVPTIAEGFVIVVADVRVGVTEACSGLSMLMVFAALTAGLVLVIKRPWWYLLLLCLSWPAIAVVANVFRIVTTAALYWGGFEKLANVTYHDLAGLAMMPVGLILLWLEISYLDRLIVLETERRVTPFLMGLSDEPQSAPTT
jgi:exosortase